MLRTVLLGFAIATACALPARADVLLIERAAAKPADRPSRGSSAADVEARYGAPTERLQPRGGQRAQWPVIHRWVYPAFTVYFERDRVVDVVAHQATAQELGPRPAR